MMYMEDGKKDTEEEKLNVSIIQLQFNSVKTIDLFGFHV